MSDASGALHRPLGHHPVFPPRIGPLAEPVDRAMLDRYRGYAVTDISDAVGRLYTMDFGIRPLYEPIPRLVGVALTVRVPPGDNWAVHGALGLARRDDVLVVDWQGYHDASGSGETALQGPIRRGLAGVVIDGSWRDVPDLEAAGLPIFGRGIAPFSPAKSAFGEINVPVSCGGVIVEPGDLVVADREGVCVVPRRHLEEVADALDALARTQATAPPPPLEGLTKNAAAFFAAVRAAEAEHAAMRIE